MCSDGRLLQERDGRNLYGEKLETIYIKKENTIPNNKKILSDGIFIVIELKRDRNRQTDRERERERERLKGESVFLTISNAFI